MECSKELNACILFLDYYFLSVHETRVHFRKIENIKKPESKKLVSWPADHLQHFNINVAYMFVCTYYFIKVVYTVHMVYYSFCTYCVH